MGQEAPAWPKKGKKTSRARGARRPVGITHRRGGNTAPTHAPRGIVGGNKKFKKMGTVEIPSQRNASWRRGHTVQKIHPPAWRQHPCAAAADHKRTRRRRRRNGRRSGRGSPTLSSGASTAKGWQADLFPSRTQPNDSSRKFERRRPRSARGTAGSWKRRQRSTSQI